MFERLLLPWQQIYHFAFLFNFRTTLEVSGKLYFVEICQVSEKLWLFNHKRADFWLDLKVHFLASLSLNYQHFPLLSCLLPSSAYAYQHFKAKSAFGRENLVDIKVNVFYILKHLEDRKALSVHIHYTWCDITLIFKMHRRSRFTPCSSIHSLKIRMTSRPCNKYEQITLSYLLSVN